MPQNPDFLKQFRDCLKYGVAYLPALVGNTQVTAKAGNPVKIASLGYVQAKPPAHFLKAAAGFCFGNRMPCLNTHQSLIFQFLHQIGKAAPGNVKRQGMGKYRNTAGFADKGGSLLKWETSLGYVQRLTGL